MGMCDSDIRKATGKGPGPEVSKLASEVYWGNGDRTLVAALVKAVRLETLKEVVALCSERAGNPYYAEAAMIVRREWPVDP